jgi:uncharacterized protein YjbI with pentapeptide repeats
MNKTFISNKKFEKVDFSQNPIAKGDYESCSFLYCNFSNADISNVNFSECQFTGCNLSMAKTTKTVLRDVKFKDCKILGLSFDNCNEYMFSLYFENSILNLCSFYKREIKKAIFKKCSLQEVDFTESDLSNSVFDDCDLSRAIFKNTILEKANFITSFNYSIDPEINSVKKAKFSKEGIIGLLDKYDIVVE